MSITGNRITEGLFSQEAILKRLARPSWRVSRRYCEVTARPHLWLTGTHLRSGAGPMYSARGRMRRLLEYCSRTCAVQPDIRLTAKKGVNRSIGIPLT